MKKNVSVAQRFSKAAPHYQQHAEIQQRAAQRLFAVCQSAGLNASFLNSALRLVDVGCGTGLLTEAFARAYPSSEIVVLDIAPGMVRQCAQRLANYAQVHGVIGDGAHLPLRAPLDLLVSSLCLQWFEDWPSVLKHWASHARVVALSVPVAGSFSQWQQAHERAGQPCGLLQLPCAQALHQCASQLGEVPFFSVETQTKHYANPLDFARDLRGLGADTPQGKHQPANLRRVLTQLPDGLNTEYRIAYLFINTPI